ncbi:MAG: hypothetical protein U5J96_13880 [Ignavibacteriaceae bacterium]|nr:hypothetical protein [Ignavibacteriaceae bacterium]
MLIHLSDFEIIQNQHWYRIPIEKANKSLKERWPPKWIAFYYTNAVKDYPQMIIHYAKVSNIKQAANRTSFQKKRELQIEAKLL